MAKAFRVLSFNKDILNKRFEANVIWAKNEIYSLELVDLVVGTDPDTGVETIDLDNNVAITQRQYVLDPNSDLYCKYVLNGDYKIDTIAADKKMVEYLNALNLVWHDEGENGKWCVLEEVLVELVKNPRTNYKFKLNIEIECSVNGENSEAASITKILERMDAGNLPAFVPMLDRYHYKLHLDLPV